MKKHFEFRFFYGIIILAIIFSTYSSYTAKASSKPPPSTSPSGYQLSDAILQDDFSEYLIEYASKMGIEPLVLENITYEGSMAYAVAHSTFESTESTYEKLSITEEAIGGLGPGPRQFGFILTKSSDSSSWYVNPVSEAVVNQEYNLSVPFTPQVPPGDWSNTKNCGQTSSAMVFGYYGFYNYTSPNYDDITSIDTWLASHYNDNRYLDPNGYYTSTTMLTELAKSYGGFSQSYYGQNWTIDQLKTQIQAGHPVIVAVYTNMNTSSYKHFMVLRGVRLDSGGNVIQVIVNDPGHSLASGMGENYTYDVATFMNAWSKQGKAVTVVLGSSSPGQTCSAPTNGTPRDNATMNTNQVTFTWSPINCDGLDQYTFRVANHSDIDNGPWIIDHGVGKDSTSVTETIPSSYNGQTLYWAIWPHNSAGYGSKGGPWAFRIDTSAPPPPPPLPTGSWSVQYFRDKEMTNQCATSSFNDTFVFQDWGEVEPASGCNSDNWGARFTRRVHLASGYYSFALEADDWGRLFVNSDLVVNKWDGATQHYEGRQLSEGDYDIKVEFADTMGLAKIAAWWWGPGYDIPHETQDPNQWYANYWINKDQWWDAFASRNEGTGILNHDWSSGSPGWNMPADNFSSKFRRTVYFECGTYRFVMDHDDGLKFWLDGVLKVDRWTGPIGYYTVDLPITRGNHNIQVDQYENGGSAHISFDWQQLSGCTPSGPTLNSPGNSSSLAWNTDLTLSWNPSTSAIQYYVQLQGGPDVDINSGWISENQWYIGTMWPGTYTWKVTARNDYGSSSPSSTWNFTINEIPVLPELWVLSDRVKSGAQITVNWSNLEVSGNDWISLHPAGTPDSSFISWKYAYSASGSLTFIAPSNSGSYEFRLFRNGTKVATSNEFEVYDTLIYLPLIRK